MTVMRAYDLEQFLSPPLYAAQATLDTLFHADGGVKAIAA
jgi:hypothetical protein